MNVSLLNMVDCIQIFKQPNTVSTGIVYPADIGLPTV